MANHHPSSHSLWFGKVGGGLILYRKAAYFSLPIVMYGPTSNLSHHHYHHLTTFFYPRLTSSVLDLGGERDAAFAALGAIFLNKATSLLQIKQLH